MRIVLTGATGTIGRAVAAELVRRGDAVVALTRDPARSPATLAATVELHGWPAPTSAPPPAEALRGAGAVINLLGEPVAQRWTARARAAIRDSRVRSTRNLVAGLRALPDAERPSVLVSQSATGYYGPRDSQPVDEHGEPGHDFLSTVVAEWEREAEAAAEIMRVVRTRTGVVLAADGGALAKMLPFFKLGVGGPVAGGDQYVPWIHLDDVVGALLRCVDDATIEGPVNLTAPNPVTNRELSRALGRALHRPSVLPVPGFALKGLYGEMSATVLTGQRVMPRRLEAAGYPFRYLRIDAALADVLAGS
jgi:uncharacterized protein